MLDLTFSRLTRSSEQTHKNFSLNSPRSVETQRTTCPCGSTLKCYIERPCTCS